MFNGSVESSKQINVFQPKFKTASVGIIILIVGLIIFLILKYVYLKSNWDSVMCDNGLFFVAPFFGENSEETLRKCSEKNLEDSIQNKLLPYDIKLSSMNTEIDRLNKNLQGVEKQNDDYVVETDNNIDNIATTTRRNIEYVKNSLEKIITSMIISTNINNGVLNSAKTLNDTSISQIVDNYNSVISKIN
jgi:hypothetical protein